MNRRTFSQILAREEKAAATTTTTTTTTTTLYVTRLNRCQTC